MGIVLTVLAVTVSSFFSNASAAGWSAWMADLVPGQIRATFFTRRSAILNAVSMAWFFVVTLALDLFVQHEMSVFAVVFTLRQSAEWWISLCIFGSRSKRQLRQRIHQDGGFTRIR
jgi:hypothetical protein